MEHYDYTILGAGCSGLCLALQLAKKEPTKRILLLESRETYVADRTWCYWDVEDHPFEHLVQNRWSKWQIRCGDKTVSLQSNRYTYCCIPSAVFYKEASSLIGTLANVTLHMKNTVTSVLERSQNVSIRTEDGEFTSCLVYDSRPEKTECGLYQHFIGWKVQTSRPVFASDEVLLMDFDVDQTEGLNFIYLLPYSSTTALVESTFITDKIAAKEIYERAIVTYLKSRYGIEQFTVLQKERGVLPLGARPKIQQSLKIVPIGQSAGWMRASTGYAFLAIHRGIDQLLSGTKKGVHESVDGYLDRVFLSYIKQYPHMAPRLFFDLFNSNHEDCLVRFLTSSWSCKDLIKVLLSMPKMAMIKQVFA